VDALGGFLAMENLVGGTDADDFVFANGAGVVGLVDGRSGYDTLDWTAYDVINAVSVNRGTLSATGTDGYAGIEQVIGGAGSDALTGANEGNTWHVTADDAGQISSVLLDFSGFENLVGGTEVDDFILVDGVLVTGVIDGRGEDDTLSLAAYGTDNTWNITGDNSGSIDALRGSIDFESVEYLVGGTGVDEFIVADGALLGDGLDGGAGDDVLDFSAYTTPNVWTVDGPNGYIETQRGNFSFVSIENQIGGQTEFHGEFVDLAGEIGDTWLPDTLVPGDRGWVAVKVTNAGNTAVLNRIDIDLYLSADELPGSGSDALVGSLEDAWVNLMPGWSATYWVAAHLPPELDPGTYYVLAEVDAEDAVTESNELNNVASTSHTWDAVWQFGVVGGRGGVSLVVNDWAGTTVTFSLYGPGSADVVGGPGFTDVLLTGTSMASFMVISTAGLDSRAVLNDVVADGSLGGIVGWSTEIGGALEVHGSLGALFLRGLDADALIGGDLNVLYVYGGDVNGDVVLTGSSIGTVMAQPKYVDGGWIGGSIRGDIIADGDIGGVYALRGGVSGSVRSAAGRIGTVLAIGGDVDLTGGKTISAGTGINAILAINGNILGDGVGSPDIYVDDGSLWSLQAVGGGMQNVWVDVNGAGPLAGMLGTACATGGGILGSTFEAASVGSVYTPYDFTASRILSGGGLGSVYVGGSVRDAFFQTGAHLSSLFTQGDFTNSSVQTGSLSVLYVGGTISEDATDGDTDEIHADTGSYFVADSTKSAQITAEQSDAFSGVAASVG